MGTGSGKSEVLEPEDKPLLKRPLKKCLETFDRYFLHTEGNELLVMSYAGGGLYHWQHLPRRTYSSLQGCLLWDLRVQGVGGADSHFGQGL